MTSCRAASQTDVGRYPAQSHQPGGQQRASPDPPRKASSGVSPAVSSADRRAVVWRGHDNSPMMPVDGVLWEQSRGWIEFIVLTRTDRAITEGITTSWRGPFITVHSVALKADELVTDDADRDQAGLIAAIGATGP